MMSADEVVSTQAQMQSLLHNSSDAIIEFNSDGTVATFNSAAERVIECAEIEMMYKPANDLFVLPEEFRGSIPAWLAFYSRTVENQFEYPLVGISSKKKEFLF